MIICFEGPSAVGKTTMSQVLSEAFTIIPEVNLLFKRPKESSKFWYYDKQFERYQLAAAAKGSAILDGDIFQPLWYNWIYGFPKAFPNLKETITYYQQATKKDLIQFPDLYIVFTLPKENLIARKQQDATRKRRNFEKHLALINPQKQYFQYLKEELNLAVVFINALNFKEAKREVLTAIEATKKLTSSKEQIINQIHDYLKENQAIKNPS